MPWPIASFNAEFLHGCFELRFPKLRKDGDGFPRRDVRLERGLEKSLMPHRGLSQILEAFAALLSCAAGWARRLGPRRSSRPWTDDQRWPSPSAAPKRVLVLRYSTDTQRSSSQSIPIQCSM
eukprot:s4890_g3.t1